MTRDDLENYDPTTALRKRVIQSLNPTQSPADPSSASSSTPTPPAAPASTAPSTSVTSQTPAAPTALQIPANVPGTDYYSYMNNLYQYVPGITGAQAVAEAAKKFPQSAPATATTYAGSPQAVLSTPTTAPTPGPVTADPTKDLAGWVTQTLKAQGSTDDPNYWIQKIQQGGGYSPYWAQRIQYAGNAQNPGGQPLPAGMGGTGPSAAPSAALAAAPASNPFNDQVRTLILNQLQSLSQPFDANSPEVTQPMDAARLEVSRSQDQARKALAERLYATGDLNTDALNQGVQQNIEQGGQALAQLRSQLVSSGLQQRVGQLQNLLSLAVQSGDTNSAQALQLQLAQLQAQLDREQMGIGLGEFTQQQNNLMTELGLAG